MRRCISYNRLHRPSLRTNSFQIQMHPWKRMVIGRSRIRHRLLGNRSLTGSACGPRLLVSRRKCSVSPILIIVTSLATEIKLHVLSLSTGRPRHSNPTLVLHSAFEEGSSFHTICICGHLIGILSLDNFWEAHSPVELLVLDCITGDEILVSAFGPVVVPRTYKRK